MFIDITTLHYLKEHYKYPFDNTTLTNLVFVVNAVKRQPNRCLDIIQNDSKNILKNISKTSKKFLYFQQLITDINQKFKFAKLELIAFICWYTFNYFDLKSFQKNKLENITEDTINSFHEWYKALNSNVHIIHGFKKSCKTIMNMRKKNGESAEACLSRLIEQDKISELYYSGGITPYFLAAIPKKKIHIPKTAIFSNKLFSLVEENKELLISKLNYASKNYLKVPVNSIDYLAMLQHIKS